MIELEKPGHHLSIYQTFNTSLREAKKLVYTRLGAKGEKLRDRMLIRPFLIS